MSKTITVECKSEYLVSYQAVFQLNRQEMDYIADLHASLIGMRTTTRRSLLRMSFAWGREAHVYKHHELSIIKTLPAPEGEGYREKRLAVVDKLDDMRDLLEKEYVGAIDDSKSTLEVLSNGISWVFYVKAISIGTIRSTSIKPIELYRTE
jgi:hypothetical protein